MSGKSIQGSKILATRGGDFVKFYLAPGGGFHDILARPQKGTCVAPQMPPRKLREISDLSERYNVDK